LNTRPLFSHFLVSRFAAGVLAALIWISPAFCGPIHDAARVGDLAKVKALVQANPDLVFSKDDDGETPLHVAAENDRKDVVEFLLANKADVKAKDGGRTSGTPLHTAARYGHKDVAELLLANKADVNAKNVWGRTPLHVAAENDHKDVAELLLANKADVNAKDGAGNTPLDAAAFYGDKAMAELLLAYKADVNARDDFGGTPLLTAAEHGRGDVARLLVANGADVNAKHARSNTPLHAAAFHGDRALAELLLANKADVNAENGEGKTPLNVAWDHGHTDVVELLRQHGGTDQGVSAITPPAALFGYWRIKVDASTTHFANIDPRDAEILEFRKDGMLDVQIEAVKMSRGIYYVTAGGIEIRLYHWPATVIFDYSVSNGVLTLKSTRGTQVYKYVSAE
jgi:ankyrin repeat protein